MRFSENFGLLSSKRTMHNKTYTAIEVARLVGLDLKSVYEGARRGEIPCLRVGRRYLFPVAAIDAWLSGLVRQ